MSLLTKGFASDDVKLSISNKVTRLNPNAEEFVPSALRSMSGNTKSANPTKLDVGGSSGKAVLHRAESTISNNSDDEAHQYWCRQLPDDIIPDFNVTGEDESQKQLLLAGAPLNGGIETSRPVLSSCQLLGTQQDVYLRGLDNLDLTGKTEYSGAIFPENQPSAGSMTLATNNWNKRFINEDHQFTNGREGPHYNVASNGFSTDLLNEHVLENPTRNPLEFLASQFPGFAAENLADVYYANCCDLSSTIKMLSQIERQTDVISSQNLSSKALAAPSLRRMDFSALPMTETHNREDLHQALNAYRYPSSLSKGTIDFASSVRKLTSRDSSSWKYEQNGFADGIVGSSISSQPLISSYDDNNKPILGDQFQYLAARPAPTWLETGEAVESKEEARDFARLQNVCLEQARQAYLIGKKTLAKELSTKGQFYGMQMKAAQGKARESIYRHQRDHPIGGAEAQQGFSRGQNPLIDLHGLHVSEAMHVLKHELGILRSSARSSGQRLQVMVCLGPAAHPPGKGGGRAPPRLPAAVEQYLLEEGLPYTQPQPGLLRVIIY